MTDLIPIQHNDLTLKWW